MNTEVFRFVSLRAPQSPDVRGQPPISFRIEVGDSDLLNGVRQARGAADRAKLLALVSTYVQGSAFTATERQLAAQEPDARFVVFSRAVAALPDGDPAAVLATFQRIFGRPPSEVAKDGAYAAAKRRLGDNIVAAAIDPSVSPQTRAMLAAAASTVATIEALAAGRQVSRRGVEDAVIVLPDAIFPLPRADWSLGAQRAQQREQEKKDRERARARLQQLSHDLTAQRQAIDEIVGTIATRSSEASQPAKRPRPSGAAEVATRMRSTGFLLSADEHAALSSSTRGVLQRLGVSGAFDPARVIDRIEAQLTQTASTVNRGSGVSRLVQIGRHIFPGDLVVDIGPMSGDTDTRHLGACPPQAIDGSADADEPVTVPTGHGEARVLGLADLMLVEQQLARYEFGEIAHIENVLKKEKRERRFRTSTMTEVSTTTETEQTTDKEQDLSSTDRFELQSQTQNVINDSASKQAGLTIHASYGPSVDATATLNYTSNSSRQHSDSVASSYARETASRAVSRIQQRTLERRFTRTVQKAAERNLHGFDNSQGAENITGVYRFVDKIYTAQVLNYGKRLMLEFIVPEPAAFWRYAAAKQPLAPVSFTRPEPPGFCLDDGKTFVPLQASDIGPETFLPLASAYGASDVQPPPPTTCLVSASRKGPDSFPTSDGTPSSPKINSDVFDVDIPDGYSPVRAIVNAYGETQLSNDPNSGHKLVIQVQDQQLFYVEPPDDLVPLDLRLEPTSKVPVSINALRFHNYEVLVTILCARTDAAYQAWQLKTYSSIMQAYQALKSAYDNAQDVAQIRAGYNLPTGRNPDENREIERGELKRGCISLMTAQRFETFDAMARDVAPFGYPEIDFAEAKADAPFIKLFEQGLEWENMAYLYYSYFWSRKDEWPTLVQLDDDDPLFARFLQAGAARVQVPVRPGFHVPVFHYLAGVPVWDADGNLINDDGSQLGQLQLAMITELKSQLGNDDVDGDGTVALTNGDDVVVGTGTEFTSEDVNRRIRFGMRTRVIRSVEGPDRIRLTTAYDGPSDPQASYALGPRLVGAPWEVRVPTDLVMLADFPIS